MRFCKCKDIRIKRWGIGKENDPETRDRKQIKIKISLKNKIGNVFFNIY